MFCEVFLLSSSSSSSSISVAFVFCFVFCFVLVLLMCAFKVEIAYFDNETQFGDAFG